LRFKEDYARAGVPMLPVEESALTVAKQIVWYSWVLFAASWVLIPVAHMGMVYHVAAVVLGTAFLIEAYGLRDRVKKNLDDLKPMRLFHWSITYLSLLFLAIGIDPFVR
jgi:protoheme IX farnesyltransferase